MTLGKDMTLRDYAQGAWRMRQIGRGQRLSLLVTPEVKRLVERAAAAGEGRGAEARAGDVARLAPGAARESRRLRDVLAWLVVNGMRAENVQSGLLQEQRAANVWRKHAYRKTLSAGASCFGSERGEGRRAPAWTSSASACRLWCPTRCRRGATPQAPGARGHRAPGAPDG